jgi:hypothetical protein
MKSINAEIKTEIVSVPFFSIGGIVMMIAHYFPLMGGACSDGIAGAILARRDKG